MAKRKWWLLTLCLGLLAPLAVSGTLAYFTDEEKAENVFTVGNVDIMLTEPAWQDAQSAYPGEVLDKDPRVTNTGRNPCFVRLSVANLDQFVRAYGTQAMIGLRFRGEAGYNTADWVLAADGCYYYFSGGSGVLESGEVTEAVFDQVVMPTALTNDAKTLPIVVTAQAVQAQGARPAWEDVSAMTVEEIAAWFAQAFPAE